MGHIFKTHHLSKLIYFVKTSVLWQSTSKVTFAWFFSLKARGFYFYQKNRSPYFFQNFHIEIFAEFVKKPKTWTCIRLEKKWAGHLSFDSFIYKLLKLIKNFIDENEYGLNMNFFFTLLLFLDAVELQERTAGKLLIEKYCDHAKPSKCSSVPKATFLPLQSESFLLLTSIASHWECFKQKASLW